MNTQNGKASTNGKVPTNGRRGAWFGGIDQTGDKDRQANAFNPPQVVNQMGVPIATWNTSTDKSNRAEWESRQVLAPPSTLAEGIILAGWVSLGAGLKNFVRFLLLTNPVTSAPVIILGGVAVVAPLAYFALGVVTGNTTVKAGTGMKFTLTLLGAVVL